MRYQKGNAKGFFIFVLLLITALCLFQFNPSTSIVCAAGTYNVTLLEDTFIETSWHDPCGGKRLVDAPTATSFDVATRPGIVIHRILLRFDIDSITPGTEIFNATLRLYAWYQSEYKNNDFHVSRLTEQWEDISATWCNRTTTELWPTVGGAWTTQGQATVLIPNKYGPDWHLATGPYDEWIEWDITQIVRDWVENGKPNFGIILHQTDIVNSSENQAILFYSKEYSDPNLTPQLILSVSPPPLSITTNLLSDGTVGTAYSQTLSATGGTPPYTWSIISGSLPAGLSLNSSTGVISGTSTTAGTSNFTVQVTDVDSNTATKALSITINISGPPPGVYTCFIATAAYGSYLDPHVAILRQFRDKYLVTNWLGNRMVSLYYQYSPPIAHVIAQHELLKTIVKFGLLPLVVISAFCLKTTMVQKFITLMLIFSLIELVAMRKRFRHS
jgi:hypothetical protein